MSSKLPIIETAGANFRLFYRYGNGPVLGVIRIGVRNGVACYVQADRLDAPASSRNAWTTIGPISDFAGVEEAADAYAAQYQSKARAAALAEAEAPATPSEAIASYHEAQCEAEDDGCPKGDPDCMGNNGDCHDACEAPELDPAAVAASRLSRSALMDAAREAEALDSPVAMVRQPVQQQQAKARAPKPARGERRYVTVRDTETGEVHRVLTSVARVGVALVIFSPSNRHREGELGGMLLTHDDVRKAWVFNDDAEARQFLSSNRAPGERAIRAELVSDPAPAMVPQPVQQAQAQDGRQTWQDQARAAGWVEGAGGAWAAPGSSLIREDVPAAPVEPAAPQPASIGVDAFRAEILWRALWRDMDALAKEYDQPHYARRSLSVIEGEGVTLANLLRDVRAIGEPVREETLHDMLSEYAFLNR